MFTPWFRFVWNVNNINLAKYIPKCWSGWECAVSNRTSALRWTESASGIMDDKLKISIKIISFLLLSRFLFARSSWHTVTLKCFVLQNLVWQCLPNLAENICSYLKYINDLSLLSLYAPYFHVKSLTVKFKFDRHLRLQVIPVQCIQHFLSINAACWHWPIG